MDGGGGGAESLNSVLAHPASDWTNIFRRIYMRDCKKEIFLFVRMLAMTVYIHTRERDMGERE